MIDDSPSMETPCRRSCNSSCRCSCSSCRTDRTACPTSTSRSSRRTWGRPATPSIGCTAQGDQGAISRAAEGSCMGTTLANGATFLSDSDGVANFTNPIADVFQCVALLGSLGCGFEHQLASIDRALGADGQGPAPAQNAGFLRDDAILAIVLLTNEDDCSAPPNTRLYYENGPGEPVEPDGTAGRGLSLQPLRSPLHGSATGAAGMPPLTPPSDASGNPPMLELRTAPPNDTSSGMLTPVSKFIEDIRALKTEPDIRSWSPPSPRPRRPTASCGPTSRRRLLRGVPGGHALVRHGDHRRQSTRPRCRPPTAASATRPCASSSS